MGAKEELSSFKWAYKRVEDTLKEYEDYKLRAEKMTTLISDNPAHSNKVSDKVGDNASAMADIESEYQGRWLQAEQEKNKIEKRLEIVKEPYRTLLIARYVKLKTFEEIAVDMGYSYDRTIHLHGEALKEYEVSIS